MARDAMGVLAGRLRLDRRHHPFLCTVYICEVRGRARSRPWTSRHELFRSWVGINSETVPAWASHHVQIHPCRDLTYLLRFSYYGPPQVTYVLTQVLSEFTD